MKKRFLPFMMAVCMICCLTMTSCSAAEAPTASANSTALTSETQPSSTFTDVPADTEYAEAVAWCQANGILAGVGDNRFDPDGTLTRAMLVSALYRAAGKPSMTTASTFTDTRNTQQIGGR